MRFLYRMRDISWDEFLPLRSIENSSGDPAAVGHPIPEWRLTVADSARQGPQDSRGTPASRSGKMAANLDPYGDIPTRYGQ
jgi:hypothetical protein